MAYLYGASVQGIQEFIFATNQLKDIVGASEIIKKLDSMINDYKPDTIIVSAAGNIKAVFNKKEDVEKLVLEFPKIIMQMGYGITISQAVVEIDGEFDAKVHINELEKKLKIQRNRPTIPLDMSINIMKLNPKTAKPAILQEKESEALDIATKQKRDANTNFFKNNKTAREFKNLSDLSNGKNKIAIIHADGNGLGEMIPKLKDKGIEISEFSKQLDYATKQAFKDAVTNKIKYRDVVLSGDDLTLICDANDAITITKNFLENFETYTKEEIGEKLTACAGIAYCNEKYPFHYAVSLAEELCSQTKKHAKKINEELAPSSLMFHNIQSSSFQSWEKIVDEELNITNDKESIRCDFGPYYLDEQDQPKIDNLINTIEAYRCDGSPISKLRSWLTELNKSSAFATNMLHRINEISKRDQKWNSCIMDRNLKAFQQELSNDNLIIDKDDKKKTPIYDVLQILSATEAK
jgi:hypothetical protein